MHTWLSQVQENNRERQLWSTMRYSHSRFSSTQNAHTCLHTNMKTHNVLLARLQAYTQYWTTLTPVELCRVGAYPKSAINLPLRTHVPYWVEVKQHLITARPASVCLGLWFVETAVLTALHRQTNRWTKTPSGGVQTHSMIIYIGQRGFG